jgi:4-hydroxy-tetrahydrodipicolinate reductase
MRIITKGENMKQITVAQMGLGPIGAGIARLLWEKDSFDLVAACDIDPNKQGKDLGEFLNLNQPTGIRIAGDILPILEAGGVQVVTHCTASSLPAVAPQIEACVQAGVHVVSTAEELAFPVEKNREIAAHLDQIAGEHNRVILGTGVNPGYIMDFLPIVLSAPCREVERVYVKRVQNASLRRKPLQEKVGAGMTPQQFEEEIASKRGHVGLPESVYMIATGLGWQLERFEEGIEPVLASEPEKSEFFNVEAGRVLGIHQVANGYMDGKEVITLELSMYLGAPDPGDSIHISGEPEVQMEIKGGLNGDIATVSIVVNSIPSVLSSSPGLKSMKDIAVPRWSQ